MISSLIVYIMLIFLACVVIGLGFFVWINKRDSAFYEHAYEETDKIVHQELEIAHHVVRIPATAHEDHIGEKTEPEEQAS